MLSHEASQGHLPPPAIYSRDGQPLLSWRVALLPELEHEELYQRFHLDEPWDSPHNIGLLAEMPKVYRRPVRRAVAEAGSTIYQVFVGEGTAFESTEGVFSNEIDSGRGAQYTFLIVEAEQPVPWTKPEDLGYAPDQPLPPLGGLFKQNFRPFSREYWQSHDYFQAAFADGHVDRVTKRDEAAIRRAITWRTKER